MNIKGKKVTLRAIEKDDLEFLREMINNSEMESKVVGWSFPVSKFAQEKWFEQIVNDKSNLRFIITNDDNELIGLSVLTNIDWKNRSVNHGLKIYAMESRNKGLGTDTLMAIMRYVFDELQFHRIEGSWLDCNVASKRLHLKVGWKIEGIKRSCIFKDGQYHDLEFASILAEDYERLIKENDYWRR